MDDFQGAFWEEEMGADWLTDSHEMLADVNFDEDGNTPAFALEMNGGGGLASSYSLLSATSTTATATIAKTVEQEQIAQATPVEVASIAPSNAIEEQVATPVSNQFPTLKVESIEEQRLDPTYLKDVAPVSSSNLVEQQTVPSGSFDQLTSASTNANEHQNSASGSSDPFAIVGSDAGEDGSFPPEFFDEIWHDNADTDERLEFETASDQFAPVDSNSIERQEITSSSFNEVASSNFNSTEHHQFASGSSDQSASITSNVAEHQQFASGSSNQVTPVTNNTTNHQQFAPVPSSQPTPVASKAAGQVQAEPISYGFPITNAQAIQAQVASTSFNQTQYTPAATGTFNYRQSVQHSADSGLWEQQPFDSQRRPTHNAAQNARVNTTSSTLQPIAHPRSAPANGLGNLASYKKPMPMWVEKGGHTGGNHYYTPLQRPEVVCATPQPQSNGTPSAPPNAIPAGTMTSDQLKETLAKVSGSFTMSLLRATLDAPTRTTSQRQLLRVVNLFGVDGKTNANISPNFRNSLDGIWTMFNTNAAYQKMMLIYVVEKILKQNPELGNDVDQIQTANGDLIEKINSLESGDPELLTKARDLLISEFIHRGHLLETSKAISQNTIKQIETKHQSALKAKQAEVDAAKSETEKSIKRMQEMQAETKKMEANMKSMQFKMQQLMTQLSAMQANLTESNQRCQVAHDMNRHLMSSATPDQIAATAAASDTSSPSKATSNYQPEQSSNPNQTITPPRDPRPAVSYYYPNEPITPPPSKKRKSASPPYIGQFYQCRVVAKKTNEICGVINNQFMVGGKNDGEHRQRCVASTCKKYTDVKDKHWVPDHIAAQYRVGQKAPLDCAQGGVRMDVDVQMTPAPATTPAGTPAHTPAPASTPMNVEQPAMYSQQSNNRYNHQPANMFNQQSNKMYNSEPTPAPTPTAAQTQTYTSPYPAYPTSTPASTPASTYSAPTPEPAIERDEFEGLGAVQAFLASSSSSSQAPAAQPVKYFKNHLIRTANPDALTMPTPLTQPFSS